MHAVYRHNLLAVVVLSLEYLLHYGWVGMENSWFDMLKISNSKRVYFWTFACIYSKYFKIPVLTDEFHSFVSPGSRQWVLILVGVRDKLPSLWPFYDENMPPYLSIMFLIFGFQIMYLYMFTKNLGVADGCHLVFQNSRHFYCKWAQITQPMNWWCWRKLYLGRNLWWSFVKSLEMSRF